jgi:hypothetical protein
MKTASKESGGYGHYYEQFMSEGSNTSRFQIVFD